MGTQLMLSVVHIKVCVCVNYIHVSVVHSFMNIHVEVRAQCLRSSVALQWLFGVCLFVCLFVTCSLIEGGAHPQARLVGW